MSASDDKKMGILSFYDFSKDGSNNSSFILPASDRIATAFAIHSTSSPYMDMNFRKISQGEITLFTVLLFQMFL